MIICNTTYWKVPVVGRIDFELWWCKIQNISKYGIKISFEFHIIWSLQYLLWKLLEGFDVKTGAFHVKMDFWIIIHANILPRMTNREPFSKCQLFADLLRCHQWNLHIWRMPWQISLFFTKIELKEQPCRK